MTRRVPADPDPSVAPQWTQDDLHRVRIVLVETSLAANVGAAARAMKTMGIRQLYLVSPREAHLGETALARASGADEVLTQARVCSGLDQALSGAALVLGTSARSRSLPWPMLEPDAMATAAAPYLQNGGDLALVFGRERSGLTNEELARCHYHVQIPSEPGFSSLNIAAAVQVLCYELRRAALVEESAPGAQALELADPGAMEGFFVHLESMLVDIGFAGPNNQRQLMLKLRRYFMRTQPEPVELNILRGIVSQAQKQTRR